MFVSWLEFAALGKHSERDPSAFAIPFARGSDDRLYCWNPKAAGTQVIAQYENPVVEAHELGVAMLDHANPRGLNCLTGRLRHAPLPARTDSPGL